MKHYADVPRIDVRPQVVVDHPSETGEGPLWDECTQTLTWNDIPAGQLFRFDPATNTNTLIYQHDGMIGGHTLQEDGGLVLFGSDGKIEIWRDGEVTTVVESILAVRGSRFNDVIADPAGRVFAGTMPLGDNGPAHLYRLDPDGSIHLVWDDLGLGNGMGFSPDARTLYHSDSNNRVVYRADYDTETGSLSNHDVLIRIESKTAVPDGMTVDASGDLWVTLWDGRSMLRFSPDGEVLGRVDLPVKKVSSVNFGGAAFETAYLTTAGGKNRNGDDGPYAGSLFAVEVPGVRGKPDYRSRIRG